MPAACESSNEPPEAQARAAYGPAELAAAHAFGADTLRIFVSQPGLDPQSAIYDPTYLPAVEAAISETRHSSFFVVVAMQDEAPAGDPGPVLMQRPALPPTAASWQIWLDGGTVGGVPTIGMDRMIAHLRAEGVRNALALDGLDRGQSLFGVLAAPDPLGAVIYAVHPNFDGGDPNETLWGPDFANASATMLGFADEWSAQAGGTTLGFGPSRRISRPSISSTIYMRTRSRSAAAPLTSRNSSVQDVPGWTPTNHDGFSPAATDDDAGLSISNDFLADYGSTALAAASAVTPQASARRRSRRARGRRRRRADLGEKEVRGVALTVAN